MNSAASLSVSIRGRTLCLLTYEVRVEHKRMYIMKPLFPFGGGGGGGSNPALINMKYQGSNLTCDIPVNSLQNVLSTGCSVGQT